MIRIRKQLVDFMSDSDDITHQSKKGSLTWHTAELPDEK